MLLPGELKEIHDVVTFLQQELALQPQNMLPKEQEHVAAGIVGLGVNGKFDEWRRHYSSLDTIYNLALDLEWSNVASADDIPDYWNSIARLVGELESELSA